MINVNNIEYNFDSILFLDVDGVLNGEKWYKSATYNQLRQDFHLKYKNIDWSVATPKKDDNVLAERMLKEIDPNAVKILNTILNKFNLAIVLSSTWRGTYLTRLVVSQCGIDNYNTRLLGYTPQLKYEGNRAGLESRGLEIVDWLKTNNYTGKYYILDDDSDFDVEYNGINLLTRHIHTNCHGPHSGLLEFHIKKFEELDK